MSSSEDSPAGQVGAPADRISNLPEHVVEEILMRLPLVDSVRTSILSRRWRYAWTHIPQLLFDQFPREFNISKCRKIVNRVLRQHRGPLHKFRLPKGIQGRSGDMKEWMLYLSRKNTKEVSMNDWGGRCKCSLDHLSHEGITSLDLSGYFFIQPSPKGFPNLRSLQLSYIFAEAATLECLITRCPNLHRLVLEDIGMKFEPNYRYLTICSQSLVHLKIDKFAHMNLRLENAPWIVNLSISFSGREIHWNNMHVASSTLQSFDVLHGLSWIQNLQMYGNTFKIWASLGFPRRTQLFLHLHYFKGMIDFKNPREISVALNFFGRCPFLSILDIMSPTRNRSRKADIYGEEEIFEQLETSGCEFPSLQHMRLTGGIGLKSEVTLVKYVLLNAPSLRSALLSLWQVVDYDRVRLSILNELLRVERKSANAKISVQIS